MLKIKFFFVIINFDINILLIIFHKSFLDIFSIYKIKKNL